MTHTNHTAPRIHTMGMTLGTWLLGLTGLASAFVPVGSEFQVNSSSLGNQNQPSIAKSQNGQTLVMWKSQDGSTSAIMGQRYDTTGNSIGSESTLHLGQDSRLNHPAGFMHADGTVMVVWEGQVEGGNRADIFGQRYDAGNNPLGPSIQVNTVAEKTQRHPAVAMHEDGSSIVLWESEVGDENDTDILGQRFNASGSPVGQAFQVNTTIAGNQTNPRIVIDHQNHIFVAWQGNGPGGEGTGLYGQRYDAMGNPVGEEFSVNSAQTPARLAPAMAMSDDGHVAVMWATEKPETTQLRLVSQYYDLGGNPTVVPDLTEFPWQISYGQIVKDLAWDSETPALTVWSSFDEVTKWNIKGEWIPSNYSLD